MWIKQFDGQMMVFINKKIKHVVRSIVKIIKHIMYTEGLTNLFALKPKLFWLLFYNDLMRFKRLMIFTTSSVS